MAYRTRSSSKSSSRSLRSRKLKFFRSRKAQFFILTAFVIVSVMYLVSRWMEPYTIIDTSSVVIQEERIFFDNVLEKAEYLVNTSKSYDDLSYNLDEYKKFVTSYASKKGYKFFNFAYSIIPTSGETPSALAIVCLELRSPNVRLVSTRSFKWKPHT